MRTVPCGVHHFHWPSFLGMDAILVITSALVMAIGSIQSVMACPFCFGSLQLTLREQIDTADATVIIRWVSGQPGDLTRQIPASTKFEIMEVLRGDLEIGDRLTIDRYQDGRRGDVFLMSGNRVEGLLQWDRSVPLSGEGLAYLRSLPPTSADATERLRHALKFLEADDDTVATDAFTVLAGTRYQDIAAIQSELPRERLRHWLFGDHQIKGQRGVYAMLLGLCGDAADRQQLEEMVLKTRGPDDYRLGIAGAMGGYLLLAKTDGLKLLEREFLANPETSSSDLAATMEAFRFIGQYAEECVAREQLARAVRRNLDTNAYPELAIADLARWEDWAAIDDLLERYHRPGTDKYVRKAIVQFMLAAEHADRNMLSAEERQSLDAAKQFIATVQQDDPLLYKQAARSFVLPSPQ